WALAARASASALGSGRQPEVALLRTHDVRDRSRGAGRLVGSVGPYRPITGEGTVLPVLAHVTDRRARSWLRVRLPGRSLGASPPPQIGWISARNTVRFSTGWRVFVSLAGRRVTVYYGGRLRASVVAVVRKPANPA